MEHLGTIKDKKLPLDMSALKHRKAVRVVLFRQDNMIPLLFVSKFGYHKLPGGGVDAGEDLISALKREVLEETGCEFEMTSEIGEIQEYRSRWDLYHINYCYLGKIQKLGKPKFTDEELEEGFKLEWYTLDDAIKTMENDKSDSYMFKFVQERDLLILNRANEILIKTKKK